MGVNAQTSVPAFTAGQVLTAAEMTEVNTGIPVFATTVTRDAAFGGTGEKVLAQGQTCYIEATSSYQSYNGSSWVSFGVGGLTLIKTQTIGTGVTSVSVTDAFSTTYDNYAVSITGGVGSTNGNFLLAFTGSTTGYKWALLYSAYGTSTVAAATSNSSSSHNYAGNYTTAYQIANIQIQNPFLAQYSGIQSYYLSTGEAGTCTGILADTTSYTGLTITASTGTITGGTIRIYGYQKS